MKCIQIENEVKTINTMRHQTIYKWKGAASVAAAWGPGPFGRGDPPPPPPPYPFICLWFDVSLYWSFSLRFLFLYISFYASNVYSTYIFRIGSSKVGLRQQKNLDFSDWVIQGGPPAAKNQVFLIFRSLLNAFWHADLRELVESFRNHQ